MDDAKAPHSYPAVEAEQVSETPRPRRVGRSQGWRERLLGVNLAGAAPGADLGGSSNYSNGNFKVGSGEGLHVNSNWTWVSRS